VECDADPGRALRRARRASPGAEEPGDGRQSSTLRRWPLFLLNVLNDDRDWPQLLKALERPDSVTTALRTTPARRANARALVPDLRTTVLCEAAVGPSLARDS